MGLQGFVSLRIAPHIKSMYQYAFGCDSSFS